MKPTTQEIFDREVAPQCQKSCNDIFDTNMVDVIVPPRSDSGVSVYEKQAGQTW